MSSPPVSEPHRLPSLLALTGGRLAPGIWQIDAIPSDAAQQAHNVGWQTVDLDLCQPVDKASLLSKLAEAARFPGYFGHNWDAAADCLSDLSWLPASGYLLVARCAEGFRYGHHDLDAVLVDVLLEVIDSWTAPGVPFNVLWETADQPAEQPDRFNYVPGPRTNIASVNPWPTPNT